MSKTELEPPSRYFPAVRKAREALKEKALELLEDYRTMIKQAAAAGKHEAALEAQRWLIDHVPAEEGQRMVDPSSDKQQASEGPRGPVVQIGFQLGNTPEVKQVGAGSTPGAKKVRTPADE